MKRYFRIAPLALVGVLTGCENMLEEDPKAFLTTESYYTSPDEIQSAMLSAYQPLGRDDVWRRWVLWNAELGSDQTRIQPDEPNFATYAGGLLMWGPEMSNSVLPWNGLYSTIYRANLALEGAGKVTFTDPAMQKRLIAEGKFLRAYSYLLLTKLYDDVPLLLTSDDHTKSGSGPRTPVEQVHAQILKDLTEAIPDLPTTVSSADYGRASRAAAQMALADLHLWRASFLTRNEWQQASDAARSVVTSAQWGLLDDYLSVFLPASRGNRELIWMLPSSGQDGRSVFDVNCNWLPRELGFNTAGGCEVVGQPTRWMYDSFPRGDYRHEVTYRTSGCSTDTRIGCITFKWPNINKYRPTNRGVPSGQTDIDFPLYRYAEALLIYAEAQNELGNTAEAIRQVNLIRARARKAAGGTPRVEPADLPLTMTRLQAREAIYMERNWELAHEAKRWFDQVRRDSMEPGYWKRTIVEHDPETAARGDVSEFRKRLPIPGSELRLNAALKQNPGY